MGSRTFPGGLDLECDGSRLAGLENDVREGRDATDYGGGADSGDVSGEGETRGKVVRDNDRIQRDGAGVLHVDGDDGGPAGAHVVAIDLAEKEFATASGWIKAY